MAQHHEPVKMLLIQKQEVDDSGEQKEERGDHEDHCVCPCPSGTLYNKNILIYLKQRQSGQCKVTISENQEFCSSNVSH